MGIFGSFVAAVPFFCTTNQYTPRSLLQSPSRFASPAGHAVVDDPYRCNSHLIHPTDRQTDRKSLARSYFQITVTHLSLPQSISRMKYSVNLLNSLDRQTYIKYTDRQTDGQIDRQTERNLVSQSTFQITSSVGQSGVTHLL